MRKSRKKKSSKNQSSSEESDSTPKPLLLKFASHLA